MPNYLKFGVEIARLGVVSRNPAKADFYAGQKWGESGLPLPDDSSEDFEKGHRSGMDILEMAGRGDI